MLLVDTGGIEPYSTDVILSQMRRQAQLAIDSAEVIILVTDIRSGVVATDSEVAAMLQKSGKPIVLCVNKCDTPGELPADFYEFYNLGLGDPIPVSSVHGMGTGDLLDEVLKYLPDTVGFQEVDPVWLATLNAGLRDQYSFVGEGRNGGASGEYNPIFYKKEVFDLIDSGTRWLSDTPNKVSKVEESSLNRIYTFALLERKSDGKRIMVINTHFDHTSAQAREKQAEVLVDYLKTVTDYPIVLTGDFNVTDQSEAYNTIVSNEFVLLDAHKVAEKTTGASYTFHGFDKVDMEKRSKIDFVFVTPDIKVLQSEVTKEVKDALLSDHNPQWTDLEF